ncbi:MULTISPECIES: ATP-binding protein [Burkholderia]|uniref:ATP-binding protein n=1 Tax=Burkholderia TaxID=32008 RepID=UPI000A744780|nr:MULTISPECIES: ATP-binding protein [Burkholderia]
MDYQIGRVCAVSGDEIIVSVMEFRSSADGESGVPDSMTVHLSTSMGPAPILIGQPGTFVVVALPSARLLCMVTGVSMKEGRVSAAEVKDAVVGGTLLVDSSSRLLTTVPVGTINSAGKFERGSDVLPTVNAPAFATPPSLLDSIFTSYAEGDFALGRLSLLPEQEAKINLDAFLSRHAAILGQTGGGKSWTVASLLQKLCSFKQATAVLFDLHGEYADAFNEDADVISASDLELPYWLMNSEELLGLMVDRSESAAPNQIAKFKELLQAAKENHPENQGLGIKKITIDTPVFFDFSEILERFRKLDTEMVAGSSKEKQGPLFGQFTRLLMRIDSRLNDRRYDLIFKPVKYKSSASMEDLFRRLLGERVGERKKVVVIDLSPVPFDVRASVISLILRCLFDFAYWFRRVNKARHPIAIFADEAHIYLNERESTSEAARHAAERIAKEGRKYGVSLTVISQRPREVSSTILSQCNSFLCLRISNPDDQSYVRNLLPDSVRGISSMFSTLRRGECILLGDSVLMPTRIRIDEPAPKPESDDASFYKHWTSDPLDLDLAKVLHAWRSQDVT